MTKTDRELIHEYNVIRGEQRGVFYTNKNQNMARIAVKLELVAAELRTRGLHHAGKGRFVTVPEE